MFARKMVALAGALLCVGALTVGAEEVPCLSQEALPQELLGICITVAPDSGLQLGDRALRSGDVLTADQAAQMTFSGPETQLEYLPVFADGTGEKAVMTIGKKAAAPVAEDSALETYQNIPIDGKCHLSGENLTLTLVRGPKRGTVELRNDGTFTYTPKKNKVGVDSFTYTAANVDGKQSREATVTITILKPMDKTQYADTQGLDCRFTAQWLKNTGIFTGETVGETLCFHPEKPVTRGEFVTMLVKALDLPVDDSLKAMGYSDDIPLWLQPFLAAAQRSGLTAALKDRQTFSQETPITAAEAGAMTELVATGTVEALAQLTEGDAPLTRAQAAQILYEAAKSRTEG